VRVWVWVWVRDVREESARVVERNGNRYSVFVVLFFSYNYCPTPFSFGMFE
jgi:hypothetical protein